MANFVKDKIVIRSLVASVAPVSLYSAGYGIAALCGAATIPYFSAIPWICIAGVSAIYPINKVGLSLFFEPAEWLFRRNLKVDYNKILDGNFARIMEDGQQYELMTITKGAVPTDINGVYLRNGPNAKYHADNGRGHFFDGDSMIHGIRIKDGRAFYCNRQTQTDKLLAETKQGAPIMIRIGEFFNSSGIFKMFLLDLERKIGYINGGDIEEFKTGTANTAFTLHGKKTYALEESCYPYNIRVDKNAKQFDIQSIGYDNFGGQLKHNVSAHPKVDRKTGELLCFGYDMAKGKVHYSLFNSEKKLLLHTQIKIESPRMIHDFMMTENYVIIPDSPLEFKPERPIKEKKFVFAFDNTRPSRYGIMKRNCQNPDQVRWFELPGHMVFHYINAWEEKNEAGDDIIRCYGCAVAGDKFNLDFTEEHTFLNDSNTTHLPTLNRYIFNLTTGTSEATPLFKEMKCEFPMIDWDMVGYKNKYAYMSEFQQTLPEDRHGQLSMYFESVAKFDLETETFVKRIPFGPTKAAGEVFFHKKENPQSEDDGYLMSFVYDWETKTSDFVMWDAKTMADEPILVAPMNMRVPNGFHSIFVPEADLE